jgi:hypothetical protein
MRDIGEWPQLGNVHRDGGRYIGYEDGPVDAFYFAGTPTVNKLYQSSVTPDRMAGVRMNDELTVSFDGKRWWASNMDGILGRLTWSLSREVAKPGRESPFVFPRRGQLVVRRLLLDEGGHVMNCGGFVHPSS